MRLYLPLLGCAIAVVSSVSCGDGDGSKQRLTRPSGQGGSGGSAGSAAAAAGRNSSNGAAGKGGQGGGAGSSTGGSSGSAVGEAGNDSGGISGNGTGDAGAAADGGTGGRAGRGGSGGRAGQSAGGSGTGDAGAGSGAGGEGGSGQGSIAITGATNLSTDAVTSGRACAEAPAYSVSSLFATGATLATAPDSGCIAADDEVLLINLQGTTADHDNVGNWELLTVSTVSGADMTFTSEKLRFYGALAGSDAGIGTTTAEQKVALIRVPHFTELTIAADGVLGAAAWDGAVGGVVALRAGTLDVEGSIDASALGYRGGRWSRDNQDCDDSIVTEAGESISGPGLPGTTRNVGGPGGIGALDDVLFTSNVPINPSAGHAQPGEAGLNPNGRTLGEPGDAYGTADATRLTMGSGASGNLTCDTLATDTELIVEGQGRAGGIVLLFADQLSLGPSGSISATPPDASRDIASSGGYVYVRGSALDVGTGRVTAQGAVAHGVSGPTLGQTNHASPGYVVLEAATVIGSSDPPANVIID